ncbi:MAG: AroB-related putative sugar phosphate phospholyase (cyclizing) [Elusimicrobiota bacterium]
MPDDLIIQSYKGPYKVVFGKLFDGLENGLGEKDHLLIDSKVASLYAGPLSKALNSHSVLKIEALETNKSLEKIPEYVTFLLEKGIKRDHRLVVIGGGIVQDIAAFMASCLLRGLPWVFYPTTLLAQSDSCIGSKSSINVGKYKNQVGTFTPPTEIRISLDLLQSLSAQEVKSGIGEMIKVHVIAGWEDIRRISKNYTELFNNQNLLAQTLHRSLEIKKGKIEIDEFDQKERLIMNYGHTFGHAIESATQFSIPHGIAVTIGMDLANWVSWKIGLIDKSVFDELHSVMLANYDGYQSVYIPFEKFFSSLAKDKKNLGGDISLILLRAPGQVYLHRHPNNQTLKDLCLSFFETMKVRVAV